MIYFVPTPIGNLQDITLRAINVFEKAKFVLCEDGRITSKLFRLIGIQNQPTFVNLIKNNEFNLSGVEFCLTSNLTTQKPVSNLEEDEMVIAVVSDAGTPTISDPGYEVVQLAQRLSLQYTVLPGATALIPALVASGRSGTGFEFLGFLPTKKGRQTAWKKIALSLNIETKPIVLYESVHRVDKFVQEAQEFLKSEIKICICQELTKMNESYWHGSVADLKDLKLTSKGEFVIVLG
jgi:16S rRNA (cytidine1402-2'-O)-methyltransferase